MKLGIGIDLGGTEIKSGRFDLATGERLGEAAVPARDGEREGGLPGWAAGVAGLVARHEREAGVEAAAIGLSAPGLASADGRCIEFLPVKLRGIEGFDWSRHLGREGVTVLNDAHAALVGERWQGGARGLDDVIMLTLGTGVGGAAISGGRLLHGHIGRAGHFGHLSLDPDGGRDICGCPGSLELELGNSTVAERSGGRFGSTLELVEAMEGGDRGAAELWDRAMKCLAAGLGSLINILDPEVVLIGGGIAAAGGHLFEGVEPYLARFEWRPGGHRARIRPAELGGWAGCYGAVARAAGVGGDEGVSGGG